MKERKDSKLYGLDRHCEPLLLLLPGIPGPADNDLLDEAKHHDMLPRVIK